jgi:Holliday junction DNA helicase RuvB
MAYLKAVRDNEHASGLNVISSQTNVAEETIQTVIEPHLMRLHAVIRTPRGRKITEQGLKLIK